MRKIIFILTLLTVMSLSGSVKLTDTHPFETYDDNFWYEPVEVDSTNLDTLIEIPDYFKLDLDSPSLFQNLYFPNIIYIGDKYEIEYSPDCDTIKINGVLYEEKPDSYSISTYELIVTVKQFADFSLPNKTVKMKLDICDEVFNETVHGRVEYELENPSKYYGIADCFYIKEIKQVVIEEKSVPVYPVYLEDK